MCIVIRKRLSVSSKISTITMPLFCSAPFDDDDPYWGPSGYERWKGDE
jgi:hypothetical protein